MPTLVRKRETKLGCPLPDLCFGAHQEDGNVGDGAPVLDSVAKREQVLLRPLFAGVEIRLFGHVFDPFVVEANHRARALGGSCSAEHGRMMEEIYRGYRITADLPKGFGACG